MKVLVAVKRFLDHATRARSSADGAGVDLANLIPTGLGIDVASRIRTIRVSEPPRRRGGTKVANVSTLVAGATYNTVTARHPV